MSYVQNTDLDRAEMLGEIGVSSFEELLEPVPSRLRIKGGLDIGPQMSEAEVGSHFRELAAKNRPASGVASFLGGGIYDRYIPATVRYVLSRSEFYTSYTPYQAEVSQGTLQAIYEYQTFMARLTAMDAANASMYDSATALAESILMACSIKKVNRALVPAALSRNVRAVLGSYASGKDIVIEDVPWSGEGTLDLAVMEEKLSEKTAAVVLCQPNYFGVIEDAEEVSRLVHESGAMLIASVDPVSLAVLAPPGEYGADIAVGEGQSLGIPQSFGGPLLGFMATKSEYIRKTPGRLVSSTLDNAGRRGFVMTLQTREQHIRREKATSNICTNEALCALSAAVYLSTLGEDGFREVAVQSMTKAHALHGMLRGLPGCRPVFAGSFFQEFVVDFGKDAERLLKEAGKRGILAGIPIGKDFASIGEGSLLIAVTEKRTMKDLESYRDVVSGKGGAR